MAKQLKLSPHQALLRALNTHNKSGERIQELKAELFPVDSLVLYRSTDKLYELATVISNDLDYYEKLRIRTPAGYAVEVQLEDVSPITQEEWEAIFPS